MPRNIYEAALYGDLEQIKELLPNADLSILDNAGNTPLHLMATKDRFVEIIIRIIQTNCEYFFNPNNEGELPIHVAIANQQHNIARELLKIPGMCTFVDSHGKNLLHHAAALNNIYVLGLLLSYPDVILHINDSDNDLKTPLDVADNFRFTNIVSTLEEHGAHRTTGINNRM